MAYIFSYSEALLILRRSACLAKDKEVITELIFGQVLFSLVSFPMELVATFMTSLLIEACQLDSFLG